MPRQSRQQYSHSKLSTFENCPRQYEYRYILKIPTETESIEAYMGKRVHEILERLYHHVGRHGRPPSLRQVLDRYDQDWGGHWHDKVEIVRDDRDSDFYRLQGERCLEGYYRRHYPFDEGETVGIEQRVSIRLDDEGAYRARGIIDRLVRKRPGSYEIHDYKSGGYLPPRQRLSRDRQLALYQIGVQQTFPDAEEVELVWHYLAFGKTIRLSRSEEDLDGLRAETIGRIDVIEASEEFPPHPGPLCRWCEYRELCPDAEGRRAQPEPGALEPAPVPEPLAPEVRADPGILPGHQLSLL
ncbi:MAG: PD-(D/E)XK nuclease family protein [Myxococcota bacterium]